MKPATGARRPAGAAARAEALGLRALTVLTDALPPRLRFGHWKRVLNLLSPAPRLGSIPPRAVPGSPGPAAVAREGADLRCLILAGALDSGGVETVVATLARGLPRHGIDVEVACSTDGRIAEDLRAAGVPVAVVPTAGLPGHVASRPPDVIALHRVDRAMLAAVRPWAGRTVPVFHAMESYLDQATWASLAELAGAGPACVAVSGSVARFFADRLPGADIRVVVNGVRPPEADPRARRDTQRARIEEAVGVRFGTDDLLIVALQRFSDQKNPAGLVDAFLLAAESEPRLHLILAGGPDSPLEVRRADVLRRMHPDGGRVHLLADSDPWALLEGGDIYALDSFAEGGPVSAVEALSRQIPVVLSDVGFARELVAAAGPPSRVVARANPTVDAGAIARERRRRHQSNRTAFADALLEAAGAEPDRSRPFPEQFTERAMIAGHAAVLRDARARSTGPR